MPAKDPDDSEWLESERLLPANIGHPLLAARWHLRGYDRSLFPIFRVPGRFAAPPPPPTTATMINIDATTPEIESLRRTQITRTLVPSCLPRRR